MLILSRKISPTINISWNFINQTVLKIVFLSSWTLHNFLKHLVVITRWIAICFYYMFHSAFKITLLVARISRSKDARDNSICDRTCITSSQENSQLYDTCQSSGYYSMTQFILQGSFCIRLRSYPTNDNRSISGLTNIAETGVRKYWSKTKQI